MATTVAVPRNPGKSADDDLIADRPGDPSMAVL
jgi:hypothetical protein